MDFGELELIICLVLNFLWKAYIFSEVFKKMERIVIKEMCATQWNVR